MIVMLQKPYPAPSPRVILSGAKDLGFSPVSNEKRSEMFPDLRIKLRLAGASLNMTGGWCLQLPVNAPDDTSKGDKRNVVSL
jgi:hypothetical protein